MQIHLHGSLAEAFPQLNGREWHANSVAEAVSLINANTPDRAFYRHIKPMKLNIYDPQGDRYIGEHTLGWDTKAKELHLMPAVEGSGRTAMVVIGTVLIIAAATAMIIASGGVATPMAWGMVTAGQVALVGTALVIGGLIMPAASDYDEREEQRRSSLYGGGFERAQQGSPMALVLGRRVRQGGVTISTGLDILQEMYDPEA